MAGETTITLVGNLTADPELRFVSSGQTVADFTVASTPRRLNQATNEWEDGETMFVRCSVWREVAQNVCDTLTKGTRVIVQGRLTVHSYESNGVRRSDLQMTVDEIGPSLRYASAKVTRNERSGNFQSGGSAGWRSRNQAPAEPVADPWAQAQSEEPPF